ncbi:WD_REPEATS_REGION domain-containing protein [Psidium guajava]|nr:WD_REPEATS_REGION domain-containing protein [Psidium guajava]
MGSVPSVLAVPASGREASIRRYRVRIISHLLLLLHHGHLIKIRCHLGHAPHLDRLVEAPAVYYPPLIALPGRLRVFLCGQALDRSGVAGQHREACVDRPVPPPHAYGLVSRPAEQQVPCGCEAEDRELVPL